MAAVAHRPRSRFIIGALLVALMAMPFTGISPAGALVNDTISIAGPGTVAEGTSDTGTTPFNFTITLTPGNPNLYGNESVTWTTADGTAKGGAACSTAGVDYLTATGSVTFAPNDPATTKTITVQVCPDKVPEVAESFSVNLTTTSATPNLIKVGTATATISAEDGTPPSISATVDGPITEGDNPATTTNLMTFTVSITGTVTAGVPISVDWAVSDGTATAGSDYNLPSPASGTFDLQTQSSYTVKVQIRGDTVDEANETVKLHLSNPNNAIIPSGKADTFGIINDDDGTPSLSVTGPTSVTEGGAATFTVTLSPASGQQVTVTANTANGTATTADYTAVTTAGNVVFAPGQTSQTISVQTTDDNFYDPNETFSLNLSNPVNAAIGTASASATITDNDTPSNFSVADATATEGGTLSFVISVSPNPNQSVSVDWTTVDGTAKAPGDYTPKSGTVLLASGSLSATVTVQTVNDSTHEPAEDMSVVLSNPKGALISDDTGVGTINDNDNPPAFTVISSAPSATSPVAENPAGSEIDFVVKLSVTSGEDAAFTFTLGASGDTATKGSDYADVTGPVSIPAGQQQATIPVAVNDDQLYELTEKFTITVVGGTGTSGATVTALGFIADNDAKPTVSIGNVEGPEGAASTTTNFVFAITLSAASGVDVTVPASTADDTTGANPATHGTDYTSNSATVTIPAGQTSAPFTVSVTGDNTPENNETFKVNLGTPTNATAGSMTALGIIDDDDGPIPVVTIADTTVAESGGNATFTISMSNTTTSNVNLTYSTANGTATAGADYTSRTNQGATITAGQTSTTVTVPITQDTTNEDSETFTVTIALGSGAAGLVTLGRNVATGTITDDDPLTVALGATTSGVTEGGANASYAINLDRKSAFDVTVSYTTNPGTATAPEDYTSATGSVTIPAGSLTTSIPVSIVDDAVNEPTENFTFQIDSTSRGSLGTGIKNTTTITDNDAPPSFAIADTSGVEGTAANGTSNMVFTVTKTGATTQTITLSYHTADDTAVAGTDYTAVPNGTVTFGPSDTTKTITVLVNEDSTPENDERFDVVMTAATVGTISDGTGVATITDDDAPPLSVDNPAAVDESAGSVTFTVTLAQAAIRTVTVDYATHDGTATDGEDYTATSGTLTFTVGQTSKTVTVPVLSDTLYEANETFTLVLSNATGSPIASSTGAATINDNDPAPSLSIADASNQEGNSVSFTVSLSTAAGRPITVAYSTTPGTASSSDFVGAPGTLTLDPGVLTNTVLIPTTNDPTDEPDEAFTVTLSNPNPGAVTITDATATGTILDNDDPAVIAINDITVRESKTNDVTAIFTVSVTPVSGKDISVDWGTFDDTATAPADYTDSGGTLVIPAGASSGTISVPVKHDSVYDPGEDFAVVLDNPDNATLDPASVQVDQYGEFLVAFADIVDAGATGYWLSASDGGIFNYGDAPFYGSIGGHVLNQPVVGMAVQPDHQGYWEVASDGGIFTFPVGSNRFYGSMGGRPLNKPIVGMAATPTGNGYWLVASDGGIFAFGDAVMHGSMGGRPLNKPIVGMAATPTGNGYWLVASDGGIFNFGDAVLYGSLGSLKLNSPIVGMASTPSGHGFWLVGRDGGIFAFGDARMLGGKGGQGIDNIVGMSPTDAGGYRLASADGHVYPFGTPGVGSPAESTPPTQLFRPVVGTTGF